MSEQWSVSPPAPPCLEVWFAYPADGGQRCPACGKPAPTVVIEDGTQQVNGLEPTVYRCEPCGHRFGRDGKEIPS